MFRDEFEENEFYGREALLAIQQYYPDLFKHQIKFTQNKFDCHDAFWIVYDEDTHKILKRVFIEIKIRTEEYEEYILEYNKVNKIHTFVQELGLSKDEYEILYINFCPKNTLIWKISDIGRDLTCEKIIRKRMNVKTAVSRTDKVMKEVYMMSIKTAKTLDYSLNKVHLMTNYEMKYLLPLVKDKMKTVYGLEEILFN
jgi:hypothetical protein